MNQWHPPHREMIERGRGERKKRGTKNCWNITETLRGGCEVPQERVWQGRAEASGGLVGMVQSSTPSRLKLFFCFVLFLKSLTPPHHQALFFSDWDMQGHQKLQVDHWTNVSGHGGPAERGCSQRLSKSHSWPREGAQEENLDKREPICEGKKLRWQCVLLYARLLCINGFKHPPPFTCRSRMLNGSMIYELTKWSF